MGKLLIGDLSRFLHRLKDEPEPEIEERLPEMHVEWCKVGRPRDTWAGKVGDLRIVGRDLGGILRSSSG